MRNLPVLIVLILLISGCSTAASPSPTSLPEATSTSQPTSTPEATSTTEPTSRTEGTATLAPTLTQEAESTTETTTTLVGNIEHGIEIFNHGTNGSPPCSTCHRTSQGGFGFSIAPNLSGISQRAAVRIQNMSAEDYIRQSILEPRSFVVPGFRDIMYPDFKKHFSEQDIADLIAYLMTL